MLHVKIVYHNCVIARESYNCTAVLHHMSGMVQIVRPSPQPDIFIPTNIIEKMYVSEEGDDCGVCDIGLDNCATCRDRTYDDGK